MMLAEYREMPAIHLIKTYCLSTMLYECEVWTLSDSSSHRIGVAWNNCFRRVLGVAGEKVSNLFNTFVTHCPYRISLI